MALQADGRIVMAGSGLHPGSPSCDLARYNRRAAGHDFRRHRPDPPGDHRGRGRPSGSRSRATARSWPPVEDDRPAAIIPASRPPRSGRRPRQRGRERGHRLRRRRASPIALRDPRGATPTTWSSRRTARSCWAGGAPTTTRPLRSRRCASIADGKLDASYDGDGVAMASIGYDRTALVLQKTAALHPGRPRRQSRAEQARLRPGPLQSRRQPRRNFLNRGPAPRARLAGRGPGREGCPRCRRPTRCRSTSWSRPAPATTRRWAGSWSCTATTSRLVARTLIGRALQARLDASDLVQETFLKAHRDSPRSRRGRARAGRLAAADPRPHPGRPGQAPPGQGRDYRRQESLEAMLDRSSLAAQEALAAPSLAQRPRRPGASRPSSWPTPWNACPADYREVFILRNLEHMPLRARSPRGWAARSTRCGSSGRGR